MHDNFLTQNKSVCLVPDWMRLGLTSTSVLFIHQALSLFRKVHMQVLAYFTPLLLLAWAALGA